MPNLPATIQSIPRTIVRNYFDAARLPLTVAETLLRRGERTGEWGPTLAFEAVEANVKQAVGSLLGDEELTREARLSQEKVAQRRRAVELDEVAEQARAEADAEFAKRREADAERRRQVEAAADARQDAVEAEKANRKRAAETKAQEQRAAAAKVEAAERKAAAKREREARAAKVAAAQAALDEQREAMEAADAVGELDQALETTKAVRKRR